MHLNIRSAAEREKNEYEYTYIHCELGKNRLVSLPDYVHIGIYSDTHASCAKRRLVFHIVPRTEKMHFFVSFEWSICFFYILLLIFS